VELLLLLVIFTIIVALARPMVNRSVVSAQAAEVVKHLEVVREAVLSFELQHEAWPPGGGRGQIPPGLAEFLPEGFSFRGPGYLLDYDDWTGSQAAGLNGVISFYMTDARVGRTAMEMLGAGAWTDGETKYSWILREDR
jgi:type II secretory pathway pseudopilin PulG